MSSGSLIIDNTDSQIQYSLGWQANGSPNEYKRTTSNTQTQGASFTFTFVGTSVTVYGTLDVVTLPNTTYVLDGGTPFPFFGQPQSLIQYQQVFYASPPLPYKTHTLVGSCVDEDAHVIIDYLVEIPLNPPANTSVPPPPSVTPTAHDSKPAPPVAAIVGGVLGSLLLILTILALYLCYYHCQPRGSRSRASFIGARSDIQQRPTFHDDGALFTPSVNQYSEGYDHDDGTSIHRDVAVDDAIHKPSLPPWHQTRVPRSYNM
ncbi:hypothetical protein AB1N83_004077 [Pleurotus pulmonarius]